MSSDERFVAMRSLALLRGHSDAHLLALAALVDLERFEAGTVLIRMGEVASDAYLLVAGQVVVQRGDEEIDRLGVGQIVGEMAFLGDGVRSATVVAATDVVALHVPPERLPAFASDPAISRAISASLRWRLRAALR